MVDEKKHRFESRQELHERLEVAQAYMRIALQPGTAAYFSSDTFLSAELDISCPTVRKLRGVLGIPSREERIMVIVTGLGTTYIEEYLRHLPGVTYHGLYMLLNMRDYKFLRKNK